MDDPKAAPAEVGSRPSIEEAFVADRQSFWTGFTKATTYAVIALVLLLIVMRITLV